MHREFQPEIQVNSISAAQRWPLARHILYATNEVSVVETVLQEEMSPHRLRASGAGELAARFHRVAIGSSSLMFVSYGDEVTVEATSPLDYYSLQIPLSGSIRIFQDEETIELRPGQACVLSPSPTLRLCSAVHTSKVAVKLSKHTVERALSEITGRVASAPQFALSDPDSEAWADIVRLAVRTVDRRDSGWLPSRLGIRLESTIVSTLLLAHSDSHFEVDSGMGHARNAAITAARLLEEDPTRDLTTDELAHAVGVAPRTLRNGFRSHFGRTPTGFRNDLRLDLAHAELKAASGRYGVSVSDIALRTGNNHLSRFSEAYRTRFGVTPSQTLRAT